MYKDITDGKRAQYDARNYWHNGKIDQLFQKARKKAWASIMSDREVAALIKEQREKVKQQRQKKIQTRNILNIPK